MADPKNEQGKTSTGEEKRSGADNGAGGKISAGTSVGNVGQSPMPHAHEGSASAQSSTLASHTSKPLGGEPSGDRERSADQSRSGKSSHRPGMEAGSDTERQDAGGMTDRLRETTDQMRRRAGEIYEEATEWVQESYEDRHRRMGRVRDRSLRGFGNMRGGVQRYVSENPMAVGLVGLAAGLLLGALLPRTRHENEMFGEWADEVRNQGLRYAHEAANMGREYVEEAFSGDDPRFSKHESEFQPDRPANRH